MPEGGSADAQREVGARFTIVGALGASDGGETFEAVDAKTGEHVALKRLVVTHANDRRTLDLLEREGRTLGSLTHPGIPRHRDSFRVEAAGRTTFFLVQDLAPGQPLDAWIASGWRPTAFDVERVAAFLLDVLTYLHACVPPFLHRDIKPANVVRADDGRLWLVDLGAVRASTNTEYHAPEQLQGRAEPASDIYGVGATMLFLLTGRSPSELPHRELRVIFRPHVHAPEPLLTWLDRALAPLPEKRFASANAALRALRGEPRAAP